MKTILFRLINLHHLEIYAMDSCIIYLGEFDFSLPFSWIEKRYLYTLPVIKFSCFSKTTNSLLRKKEKGKLGDPFFQLQMKIVNK